MTAASKLTITLSNAPSGPSRSAARTICSPAPMAEQSAGRLSPHCWRPPSSTTSNLSPISRMFSNACPTAIR
jgi:hypothetical protein